MRNTLLVSTAALLAGIGLASAQGMQGGGQSGAAPSAQSQGAQGGAAGQERQSPQSSPSQRSGQAQQGQKEPMQKDTTGQAQRDQGAPAKAGQDDKAQPQRSGQGQRDQQSPTQAQSPQRQQNQQGQSGQATQGQGAKGGSATLTTEQRTTIRKTVLSGGNVPRATNVNFSVSVGTTVPTSVRVVAVPSTLIGICGMAWSHVFRRQRRDHYRRQQSPDHCGARSDVARTGEPGPDAALSLRLCLLHLAPRCVQTLLRRRRLPRPRNDFSPFQPRRTYTQE
jgi:hypothetical protein